MIQPWKFSEKQRALEKIETKTKWFNFSFTKARPEPLEPRRKEKDKNKKKKNGERVRERDACIDSNENISKSMTCFFFLKIRY